jgi:hypothetical protein
MKSNINIKKNGNDSKNLGMVSYITNTTIISKEKIFKENPQNKLFYTKEKALEYLEKHKNLYLYSEDKDNESKKQFYILDRKTLFNLSIQKKFNLYEHVETNNQVKLFIDIDLKTKDIPKNKNAKKYFKNIIEDVIELLENKLIEYDIKNPSYIILDSSREDKLSTHIIFPTIIFNDILTLKYFMLELKSPYIEKKIIDLSVYKVGCFRLLWNSKFTKNSYLEYLTSKNYIRTTDEQLFMDTSLINIPLNHNLVNYIIPKNLQIKTQKIPKNKKHYIDDITKINNDNIISLDYLKQFVDLLNPIRADDYNEWLNIGMCLYNCNPNVESFNLWHEFSKKSPNYDGIDICKYKWSTFRFSNLSIASLKYKVRKDSPEEYAKLNTFEDPKYHTIKFNQQYLMDKNDKIKNKNNIVTQNIDKWITNDNIKTLVIKSPYDTGKTTVLKSIIEEYVFKRILFITYRQSLTDNFYGIFKNYKVKSYLDGDYHADRIICQIDSLKKLLIVEDYINDEEIEIPSYDLVICDEIESSLAHFNSSTIADKEDLFNYTKSILDNSKKIICLDGDFSNRSYEFVKELGEHIILENTVKKNNKHFIFTDDRKRFDYLISDDLKNGKNVVIISMSANDAKFYYSHFTNNQDIHDEDLLNLIEDEIKEDLIQDNFIETEKVVKIIQKDTHQTFKYRVILHCSDRDDKLKKCLKKVEEFWIKCQLLIYSPSIIAGVSFDIKHFIKMYIILSPKSCSPRDLMQMTARIRKLEDNNIIIYLNKLPFREVAYFYNVKEVELFMKELQNTYFKQIIKVNENGKNVKSYKYGLYEKILVYNET